MIWSGGIAVFAAAAVVSQQTVPRVVQNGDAIEVVLPAHVFRNEQFLKSLATGLTTAVVMSVDSHAVVRIQIRYDLWDEIYHVTMLDATAKREQLTLATIAKLQEWLDSTHFYGGAMPRDRAPSQFQVGVDVVPFSATEQEEAQRWLLHSIHRAEGQSAGAAANGATIDASGAFDRMIAGSVQPKALLSWHWKVPLTRP